MWGVPGKFILNKNINTVYFKIFLKFYNLKIVFKILTNLNFFLMFIREMTVKAQALLICTIFKNHFVQCTLYKLWWEKAESTLQNFTSKGGGSTGAGPLVPAGLELVYILAGDGTGADHLYRPVYRKFALVVISSASFGPRVPYLY